MKGNTNWGVAQLASASGLGPEGPVFESQYPDFKKQLSIDSCFFLYIFEHKNQDHDTGKGNREVVRQLEGAQRY